MRIKAKEASSDPGHVIELLFSSIDKSFTFSIMWRIKVFTILSVISVHTLAFSWRRHDPSGAEHTEPQDLVYPDIGLDKDAIGSVDSSYKRKPDCFRRAAARIRVRCAEIDMDAGQRVKAAISMTLCELRTAEFHSIPLECEVFLEEGGLSERAPHGICVEALSRSTQSWASYSGYLREIPQLCFAYQRSNEKDLALEIYRNATIEKIAYIRHLMQRAEKEDEAHTLWQSLLLDLQGSINSLQAFTGLVDKIYVDISARVLHELQQVMRTQMEAFDTQLQETCFYVLSLHG
ncbi:hypothetical protein DFH94DRAFT_460798 [Russula ochroleuca]|uniref:Uncharacterized protein n=1 Tax=Russula ochroleuca TaxID=152965 RepID=A0A9P5MW43_9AGAM|nr:hypothetical protein DFH94DRAFT_460798 [Russula ochroleuca]